MSDKRTSRTTQAEGDERFVTLGRVSGAHGIRGWVKVHSETSPRGNIFGYTPWTLVRDGNRETRDVEDGRVQGKAVVVKLAGCDDRDAAEDLAGAEILVNREQLPATTRPGEYYWADLVGLEVFTLDGTVLGRIERLFETGANDVIVVKGERERLLPYVWQQVVREVDLEQGVMRVDWDPDFEAGFLGGTGVRFDVVSLFPEMFDALRHGVTGRALERGQATLTLWNPRDFADDVHRTVDDRPYGGGPGMVMMVEPLRRALAAAGDAAPDSRVLYLSPQGRRLDDAAVRQLATGPGLILLAGRYEGIDERLIETFVGEELSIGDYVLSGGELPAMVLMDAVIRMLPGVLGHVDSTAQDSYAEGLLDCPHYTRPDVIEGRTVPEVLMSGNHERIRRWRLQQALGRTWLRRPDLLEGRRLNDEEQDLLDEFIRAHTGT